MGDLRTEALRAVLGALKLACETVDGRSDEPGIHFPGGTIVEVDGDGDLMIEDPEGGAHVLRLQFRASSPAPVEGDGEDETTGIAVGCESVGDRTDAVLYRSPDEDGILLEWSTEDGHCEARLSREEVEGRTETDSDERPELFADLATDPDLHLGTLDAEEAERRIAAWYGRHEAELLELFPIQETGEEE